MSFYIPKTVARFQAALGHSYTVMEAFDSIILTLRRLKAGKPAFNWEAQPVEGGPVLVVTPEEIVQWAMAEVVAQAQGRQ